MNKNGEFFQAIDYPYKEYLERRNEVSSNMEFISWSKKVETVCLSHYVDFFPHLMLNPNYDIVGYTSGHHHGTYGKTVALKKGEDWTPKLKGERTVFQDFDLPTNAADVMSVITCDGTAESFVETILLEELLQKTVFTTNYGPSFNLILEKPKEQDEKWEYLMEIQEWRPVINEDSMSMYMLSRSDPSEYHSDDSSEIYLNIYQFYSSDRLVLHFCFDKEYLLEDIQYDNEHRPCLHKSTRIPIAFKKNK